MTEADRQFYEPWWARLRAAHGKPQHIQNRRYRQFFEAAHEREAIQRQAKDEAEAARLRAVDAARKRASRARERARK